MKNKWLRRGALFLTIGCLAFAAAGCKGEEVMDKVLENTDPKQTETEKEKTQEEETLPEVEVAKPELTANLGGSVTYKQGDAAQPLKVEASTTDGGVITYQWYQSTSNTTGGGTLIEGATENTYTPSTQEEGTMYYYAVATSTIQGSTNGITSAAAEVIVTAAGDAAAEGQENEAAEGEKASQEQEQKTEESKEQPAQPEAQ